MELTTESLARMLGGTVEGDPHIVLKGFAKIEEAGPGDLSFIANPKYLPFVSTTRASALLVNNNFQFPDDKQNKTLIRVEDPYSSLASIMRFIENAKPKPSGIEQPSFIAEDIIFPESSFLGAFSYLSSGVVVGENVLIYPQVFLGKNVKIGNGTIIYAGVKIYDECEIGKNCIIHSGAVIGADGFGFAPSEGKYEKIPQTGKVVIEDDVEIGANTTIDRATFGKTVVGKGTKLDNLIQIAHNVTLGENNVLAAQVGVAGSTHIGNSNRIGGQCGFAGHITIGNDNEFGAQSGIPKNVGDNQRLIGYPAVDIKQFAKNVVYLKRLDEFFKEKSKTK